MILRVSSPTDPWKGHLVFGSGTIGGRRSWSIAVRRKASLISPLAAIDFRFRVSLLGRGLEDALATASLGGSSRVAVRIGYHEPLAHRLNAAADIALTPSRFEPCGLSAMYAMRYGAPPVTGSVDPATVPRHLAGLPISAWSSASARRSRSTRVASVCFQAIFSRPRVISACPLSGSASVAF